MTGNEEETVTCEVCGTTAAVEQAPPDQNPLPSGWSARVDDSSPLMYDRTAYRCSDCPDKLNGGSRNGDESDGG